MDLYLNNDKEQHPCPSVSDLTESDAGFWNSEYVPTHGAHGYRNNNRRGLSSHHLGHFDDDHHDIADIVEEDEEDEIDHEVRAKLLEEEDNLRRQRLNMSHLAVEHETEREQEKERVATKEVGCGEAIESDRLSPPGEAKGTNRSSNRRRNGQHDDEKVGQKVGGEKLGVQSGSSLPVDTADKPPSRKQSQSMQRVLHDLREARKREDTASVAKGGEKKKRDEASDREPQMVVEDDAMELHAPCGTPPSSSKSKKSRSTAGSKKSSKSRRGSTDSKQSTAGSKKSSKSRRGSTDSKQSKSRGGSTGSTISMDTSEKLHNASEKSTMIEDASTSRRSRSSRVEQSETSTVDYDTESTLFKSKSTTAPSKAAARGSEVMDTSSSSDMMMASKSHDGQSREMNDGIPSALPVKDLEQQQCQEDNGMSVTTDSNSAGRGKNVPSLTQKENGFLYYDNGANERQIGRQHKEVEGAEETLMPEYAEDPSKAIGDEEVTKSCSSPDMNRMSVDRGVRFSSGATPTKKNHDSREMEIEVIRLKMELAHVKGDKDESDFRVTKLTEERDRLASRSAELELKLSTVSRENEVLTCDDDGLRKMNLDFVKDLNSMTKERDVLQARVHDGQVEMDKMKVDAVEMRTVMQLTMQTMEKLTRRNKEEDEKQYLADLAAGAAAMNRMMGEPDHASAEIEALLRRVRTLEQQCFQHQAAARNALAERDRLRAEVEKFPRQNERGDESNFSSFFSLNLNRSKVDKNPWRVRR